MSSYEQAPAVALVAAACCVCGRPLLEAESLKTGIGPVCAERTGFGREGVPPEVRAEVNRLVYELAAYQRDPRAVPHLARLRALGFEAVAARIEERLTELAEITLTLRDDGRLLLEIPFVEPREKFDAVVADLRKVPGRRVETLPGSKDGVRRCTTIPNTRAAILSLYGVMARHFAGRVARSPKGLFVVPTAAAWEELMRVRRIGSTESSDAAIAKYEASHA